MQEGKVTQAEYPRQTNPYSVQRTIVDFNMIRLKTRNKTLSFRGTGSHRDLSTLCNVCAWSQFSICTFALMGTDLYAYGRKVLLFHMKLE